MKGPSARLSNRPANFALYNWYPEHGLHLVHPDDRDGFMRLMPAGRVFGFARVGDWTVLSHGASTFRVLGDLLRPLPEPRHWLGDEVRFFSGGETRSGVVRDVLWHFSDAVPFYLLSADGKALNKRYLDDDLLALT